MGAKAVLVAATCAAVTTILCCAGSVAADAGGDTSALVEAATCARPTPPPPPPADAPPGSTFVSFGVPNQVRLRTEDGIVVAASSNTGCAPRPDDVMLVEIDGGPPVPATTEEVAETLAQFRRGDWRQPGAWHAP